MAVAVDRDGGVRAGTGRFKVKPSRHGGPLGQGKHQRLISPIPRLAAILAYLAHGMPASAATSEEVAMVKRDGVPLHAEMAVSSRILGTLKRGESVSVAFAATTAEGNWCLVIVSVGGRKGFVDCGDLERQPTPQWRHVPATPPGPPSAPRAWEPAQPDPTADALLKAAGAGDTATVQALLAQGMSQAAKDAALRLAALGGHTDTVQALLASGAQVDFRDLNDQTLLSLAADAGHTGVVSALAAAGADVNARNRWEATPLMVAAHRGHLEMVQALLSRGADVKAQDARGQTVLIIAANMAGRVGIRGKMVDHVPTIQALLVSGADVNARDAVGRTALMFAAANGHLGAVEALLAAGADVHVKDKYAGTALREASEKRHTAVVRLLKQAGARE